MQIMLLLTAEQAARVRGPSDIDPGAVLDPIALPDGSFALPVSQVRVFGSMLAVGGPGRSPNCEINYSSGARKTAVAEHSFGSNIRAALSPLWDRPAMARYGATFTGGAVLQPFSYSTLFRFGESADAKPVSPATMHLAK